MSRGPEPSCNPGHAGHSSGHCPPVLGLQGLSPCVPLHQRGYEHLQCTPPARWSSLWHKHRTLDSQLSKEGQQQEHGGMISGFFILKASEAALGVRKLEVKAV